MRISGFLIFEFPFLSPKNPSTHRCFSHSTPFKNHHWVDIIHHHFRHITTGLSMGINKNCRLPLLIGMKQKLVTSYQPHLLVKCCR
ncbi:hypothetical protein Hanom_Chr04g00283301 [Helianthus anomalus]